MPFNQENVAELASRWKKARLSAIRSLGDTLEVNQNEIELLRTVNQENKDLLLRRVFDNSRRLGLGFAKHCKSFVQLKEVREILPKLDAPCFSGQWYFRDNAIVREVSGCVSGLKLGSFYCDYWREAADGLTMGMCENVFFARHGSCRHSDERCLDVWFEEVPESHRQIQGMIPEWSNEGLNLVREQFRELGVEINFQGVSEGQLYYQIVSKESPSCADQNNWDKKIQIEVSRFWPGVTLKNTSPVAVYGDRINK